jgi:hypothetical protein
LRQRREAEEGSQQCTAGNHQTGFHESLLVVGYVFILDATFAVAGGICK